MIIENGDSYNLENPDLLEYIGRAKTSCKKFNKSSEPLFSNVAGPIFGNFWLFLDHEAQISRRD